MGQKQSRRMKHLAPIDDLQALLPAIVMDAGDPASGQEGGACSLI